VLLWASQTGDKGDMAVLLQRRKRAIVGQLGIAPETLSRVLRHLRERSLISGSDRVLNLVDPTGLRSLAGV
jgi:CRP-like cAMP-binding protein